MNECCYFLQSLQEERLILLNGFRIKERLLSTYSFVEPLDFDKYISSIYLLKLGILDAVVELENALYFWFL